MPQMGTNYPFDVLEIQGRCSERIFSDDLVRIYRCNPYLLIFAERVLRLMPRILAASIFFPFVFFSTKAMYFFRRKQ